MVELCEERNILGYYEPRYVDGFRDLDRIVMVVEGCISVNGQSIKHVSITLWK